MQSPAPVALADIEAQIARGERKGLIITAVIAAASIAAAAAFLIFTYYKLHTLATELTDVRTELETSQKQLSDVNQARTLAEKSLADTQALLTQQRQQADTLKAQLADSNEKLARLESQIQESTDLARYLHPIDFGDAKWLDSTSPRLGNLLVQILELRDHNIPFNLANRPDVGFSSPGFAGYVLQLQHRLPTGAAPDAALGSLPRESETASPKPGDIVLYETGFAMFYLKDHAGNPFVIGMTPKGIAALTVDFGVKRTGLLRTGLD